MKASVIIPSYNHSVFVLQAIQSVLAQDWPDIDLIVIDDGSKDDSVEVINTFLQENGGFRFYHRGNRGVSRTLNEGLALAKGEVVCLCASDDFLAPESIRCRAEFLLQNPDNVAVFADAARVSDSEAVLGYMIDDKRRDIFKSKDPVPYFIEGLNLPIHTMLTRKEVFTKIGGFDTRYRVCEDLDVQLLHFLEGKVGFVDEVVYHYRWHETNTSHDIKQKARADMVLLYEKYLYEVEKLKSYRPQVEKALVRQYFRFGRYLSKFRGDESERTLFRGGWKYLLKEPRLLYHLLLNEFRLLGCSASLK